MNWQLKTVLSNFLADGGRFNLRFRELQFTRPATTSRGTLPNRPIWLLELSSKSASGLGEVAPFPGLSREWDPQFSIKLHEQLSLLQRGELFLFEDDSMLPSLRMGLESALLDWMQGGNRRMFDPGYSLLREEGIPINGLIWMEDPESMLAQAERLYAEGFRTLKCKVGALDFSQELAFLSVMRERWPAEEVVIKCDANGAFSADNVFLRLEQLAQFSVQSIEQPIRPGQETLLAEVCSKSPIPIALDEELIPFRTYEDKVHFLSRVQPQYLVLKPTLVGGFLQAEEWIRAGESVGIDWWATSALESNVGLNAIAQWSASLAPGKMQGLGTGRMFTENTEPSLVVKNARLWWL